jgi:tetratricopeptide (TPR) repeat protein
MESLAELLATGRLKEASAQARRRLAQNPGDPEALMAMARVALVEGRIGESESLLARASSKAPPEDATLLRAALAAQKGEWAVARDLYESLTRQPQAPAEAWYGLGLAHASRGEWPAAGEALEKAVQARDPTRPEPTLHQVLASVKGGRDAEVADLAAQLVRGLPPEHPLAAQARRLVESLGN